MSKHALQTGGAQALLEGLDPEQRAVATHLLGPLCVIAGAGTGKTRAITHRIAYGVQTGTYSPAAVLAVTFTSRAAGEMRERLRALGAPGVQARTFHSAALRQLTYFLPRAMNRAVPRLIEHKAPLVAQAAGRLGFEVDRAAIRDLAAEIEWSKVHLWTADDYREGAAKAGRGQVAGLDAIAISRVIGLYEQVLGEAEAMDFEDVLLVMCGLMEEKPLVADQIRSQYRHFVVDEYQDVSPLQQRLLDLWLGGRQELCVVGDPAQTSYSFAGATSSYLTGFGRRFKDATTVRLVRDYRSTPQVVGLANSVLRVARRSSGGVELVAQRPAGPEVRFRAFADDASEAKGIVDRAAELINGGLPAEDIAVLYRTNGQSEPLETAFAEAGIAFHVRGGERFFARREVREALVLLRAEAQAAVDQPPLERVHEVLRARGWTEQAPTERGAVRDRWESLDALAALSGELLETQATTLAELVALIDQRAAAGHAPAAQGVTLASLHSAKGLEWEAVFLAGLSDGLLPISLADGPAEVEEERRLLYVGITRAKQHLQLSYANARTAGGSRNRKVSRFLAGLWPSAALAAKRVKGLDVPEAAALSEPALARFEALKAWRLEVARQAGLPAYTVFTDVTLRALADRAPSSVAGLMAVPGIGPAKLDKYGAVVLALLSELAAGAGASDGA
ncbi:MAG: ATP-dependent DNA helicase UvrD2 [Bifidobacteriaceae bacterium]|nr:ATP-dependent DNA helicase UvrD2 [Bifidobacteriaceae bacterium]